MQELIRQLGQYPRTDTGTVTLTQAAVAVILSFVLSLIIGFVYRTTHSGTSYSQSYVHTLVIMSVVVSLIMIIIGSNIARAFSLVGALSIIRFRSAIKETRDVAFVFLVMAIGMACGTQFYDIAVLFTLLMCGIIYFLHRFDVGAKPMREMMVKILARKDLEYESAFKGIFAEYLSSFALLTAERLTDETLEIVYSVQFKKPGAEVGFLDAVRAIEGTDRVALVTGAQNVHV